MTNVADLGAYDILCTRIEKAVKNLENGGNLSDFDVKTLLQEDYYGPLRDLYRELLLKIILLDDEDEVKKLAYSFIDRVLEVKGSFDLSVILALAYHKISPLSADLLCKHADKIRNERMVGRIIYNNMITCLNTGKYHDIVTNTHCVLSPEETEQIKRIADAYMQCAN